MDDTGRLLSMLLSEDRESAWLEFKENLKDPEQIGQYVSALANGAALEGRASGYLVWGIDDSHHAIVGTRVDPPALKVGNEDLEPWLVRLLTPQVQLQFLRVESTASAVWLMQVGAASSRPVSFNGVEYVRVGSYKKPLKGHPEHERRLWRSFERESFETAGALDRLRDDEVLELIDYPGYFRLIRVPLPENRRGILEYLEHGEVIKRSTVGWAVSNLGAALFARDLGRFPSLTRKSVRVVQYEGDNRVSAVREREGQLGYAVGFQGMIEFITALLPSRETIGSSLREEHTMYPEIALRELLANMVIHQDFTETGTGPMVEIFANRIEITNPGRPIIDVRRFVDFPAKSRNEKIARMMRRCHLAEERGTGWDKVAAAVERDGLPAPRIEVTDFHTRTVLLAPKRLSQMDRDDRVRSVYLHTCLRHVSGEAATNASVRARFGIASANTAQASRVLKESVDSGWIGLRDPSVGFKSRRYLPYWALDDPGEGPLA